MSEQKIITLTDREKCRLRMPVFFGSFDSRDMTFIETLMNARDELVNHCNWDGDIAISLSDDCLTLSVEDNGRGIPLSKKDENGEYNYIKLFETLFSGCNFENSFSEDSIETIGQNGVGATCTAYNSLYYQAIEYRDGVAREVTYEDGCLNREYKEYPSNKKHGTKVTFKLDNTTFTNVKFNPEYIGNYIRKVASTTNNITYTFTHLDHSSTFIYSDIEEYFESIVQNQISNPIHFTEKTYEINGEKEGKPFVERDRIEVLLSLSTEPVQETYLNGGYLEENGTFYIGIIDGVRKYFQKHVDKKVKLTQQDIEMSFNIYGIMGSNNPIYSNQTKKSASNELYKKIVSDYIISNMEIYKAENPQEFDKMLKHLQQINTFNSKNENSIKNIKKKLNENSGVGALNKIPNLIECKEKDVNKRILCICEGKSSLGAILNSKNDQQAIFPLRGKVLNCLKASDEKIFQNDVIIGLLMALGADAEQTKSGKIKIKFPPDKLRYSKIYIMVDFDFDGIGSILPLLLTAFYKLTPQLIEENRIYLCETPKYEVVIKNTEEELYAFYDEQLDEIKSKLNNGTYDIHYIKGLSELSEEAMSVCLSGQNDNAKLLRMGDVERTISELELWMGEKIDPRKEYIMKHFGEEGAIE